jgi:hypothetical protein
VLVRADLPLPDQIVQVGHACLEAGRRFQPADGCHIVVLTVTDQIALVQTIDRLTAIDVQCAAFYEPDNDFGLTAICTEPIADQRRRFFRNYPLWSDNVDATARGPPSRCPAVPPTG